MDAPIRAASLRFTRVDPSRWPKAVRTLVALGFNAIDLPLVWREYVAADGSPDEVRLAHDLAGLLRIIGDAGARAVLRLGPWPTADVEGLGVPDGVLSDPSVRSHTRRRNPRWVSDHLRVVPLPSLRSATYNAAARRWIGAAVQAAVAGSPSPEVIARVLVGHGAPTLLRDAPDDIDASGLDPAAVDAAEAEAEGTVGFLLGLSAIAREAGAPEGSLRLVIQGDPLASSAAARLAGTDGLAWSAPPTRAGVRAIWRDARLATTLSHGHHLDLHAGHAPTQAPSRATDALDVARIALGAGARDITVLHGCSGGDWVGAILDEQGEPRLAASRWQALLSWAASLPQGVERGRRIGRDPAAIARARGAAVFGALPLSWLSRWGFSLDELSSAPVGTDALEAAATAAGEAWAPTFTMDGKDDEAAAVALDPASGAMVRAVDTAEGRAWVLASVGLATVAAAVGGAACAVEPGAVVVLRDEERAGG
ncbi:MAG: beta-galactosidase [Deltaproteobacteria bacterium]|nr:beta-galactosidase [Deltaproteobacteria bacterium]